MATASNFSSSCLDNTGTFGAGAGAGAAFALDALADALEALAAGGAAAAASRQLRSSRAWYRRCRGAWSGSKSTRSHNSSAATASPPDFAMVVAKTSITLSA
eukprot:Skav236815  [mRNA]  locus=scaffold80:414423:418540:- [translate_table: standard]